MSKQKIVIAGAGFAGSILAQQLLKYTDAEVIIFDKCTDLEASDTGTGLNLNSNGLAAIKSLDEDIEQRLRSYGLPRKHMSAETMSGERIYKELISDDQGKGIAGNTGLRIRWADAYTAVRQGLPILYNTELVEFGNHEDGKASVTVMDRNTGSKKTIENVDLIVGADGRYSQIRQEISPAEPEFIGVSNFRVLVPDNSGDIFGDMELIYNPYPTALEDLDSISENFNVCARSIARVGIMKMPRTPTRQPMLYMYGNFTIPDEIPDEAKTREGLLSLYTPRSGNLSAKGKYVLKIISENAENLHWARMQYTPICFGDVDRSVLLLGDASHAIVPTLGQGATIAIEDACYASKTLVDLVRAGNDLTDIISTMQKDRTDRHQFISDVSIEASRHMMPDEQTTEERISGEVIKWADTDSSFRNNISRVWNGAPNVKMP